MPQLPLPAVFLFGDEEAAADACYTWQRRLKLTDWDVQVLICRDGKMDAEDACGTCYWQDTKRRAVVRLLDPVDYPPDSLWPQDHEYTLVHELLHLWFAPLHAEDGTPAGVAEELAIHRLAEALLAGYRR